jgi:hypothetical protein
VRCDLYLQSDGHRGWVLAVGFLAGRVATGRQQQGGVCRQGGEALRGASCQDPAVTYSQCWARGWQMQQAQSAAGYLLPPMLHLQYQSSCPSPSPPPAPPSPIHTIPAAPGAPPRPHLHSATGHLPPRHTPRPAGRPATGHHRPPHQDRRAPPHRPGHPGTLPAADHGGFPGAAAQLAGRHV